MGGELFPTSSWQKSGRCGLPVSMLSLTMQVPLTSTASQGMIIPFKGITMTSPGTRSTDRISSTPEGWRQMGKYAAQTGRPSPEKPAPTAGIAHVWGSGREGGGGACQEQAETGTHAQREALWVQRGGGHQAPAMGQCSSTILCL